MLARTQKAGFRTAAGRARSWPVIGAATAGCSPTVGAFLLGGVPVNIFAAYWPAVIGETERIALALEPPAQGRGVHDPPRCHLAPEPAAPPRCPLKTKAVNVLPAC